MAFESSQPTLSEPAMKFSSVLQAVTVLAPALVGAQQPAIPAWPVAEGASGQSLITSPRERAASWSGRFSNQGHAFVSRRKAAGLHFLEDFGHPATRGLSGHSQSSVDRWARRICGRRCCGRLYRSRHRGEREWLCTRRWCGSRGKHWRIARCGCRSIGNRTACGYVGAGRTS